MPSSPRGWKLGAIAVHSTPNKPKGNAVGLMSLVPAIVDAVDVPVIAAGGIADGRGVAAALILGASAVMVGTALLRSPEALLPTSWADALARARPEDTAFTRAFSGRLGRSLRTAYVRAWWSPDAPLPAPYPVQAGMLRPMREAGMKVNDLDCIAAWAGQSARMAPAQPAGEIVRQLWANAEVLLEGKLSRDDGQTEKR